MPTFMDMVDSSTIPAASTLRSEPNRVKGCFRKCQSLSTTKAFRPENSTSETARNLSIETRRKPHAQPQFYMLTMIHWFPRGKRFVHTGRDQGMTWTETKLRCGHQHLVHKPDVFGGCGERDCMGAVLRRRHDADQGHFVLCVFMGIIQARCQQMHS